MLELAPILQERLLEYAPDLRLKARFKTLEQFY